MNKKLLLVMLIFLLLLLGGCTQDQEETPTPLPPAPTSIPEGVDTPLTSPTPIAATAESPLEPTTAPDPTSTAEIEAQEPPDDNGPQNADAGVNVAYNGIYLFVPADLAAGVTGEDFPPDDSGVAGPGWNKRPAYDLLSLQGYPSTESFLNPQIEIYPVLEAASRNVFVDDEIRHLEALIAEQPGEFLGQEDLPFLPLFNAAQVMTAQEKFLLFNGGTGLRYLTSYAQDISPINNGGIFYTFQGLTDDGRYYVSAVFPVRTDALPDDTSMSQEEYQAFVETFAEYLTETRDSLNTLSGPDFTPDLDSLDALIRSIEIDRMPPEPATDEAGALIFTMFHPVEKGEARIGTSLQVSGFADPAKGSEVVVKLSTGPNSLAATNAAVDAATGQWSAALEIPTNVTGQALVSATHGDEQIVNQLRLWGNDALVVTEDAPAIELYSPSIDLTAVAGYPVYFTGRVSNPINNSVSIGILVDNCTTWSARQTFRVEGSADWQGMVILPKGSEEDGACAVAYTGTYGEGEWREVQNIVPILAADDPGVTRIRLESPFSLIFQPGETAMIAGMAVNAPEIQVTISDSNTGDILAEGVTTVGDFGQWQIPLPIPADSPDLLKVEIEILEDGTDEPTRLTTYASIARG